MKSEFYSKEKDENLCQKKNFYYLKYNENLSSFFSNVIKLYQNEKNKTIILNSIFFEEESLELFFISYDGNSFYLVHIPVNNSKQKNIKEIQLNSKDKNFRFGNIKFSEDKNHLVLFNEEKNKIFILFNYILKIKLDNQIILENHYENTGKKEILDIKFNCSNGYEIFAKKDYILYGIYCNNKSLSLFNNKYSNQEFIIHFNEPFSDFQLINNINGGCDLYIMYLYGNFKFIKDINNIENIPKNDRNELFQKITIYDKIIHNINNYQEILKNGIIKFYGQSQIDNKEKLEKSSNIITILRIKNNFLEIGALINNKLFILKKYYLENGDDNNNFSINSKEERIIEIIPMKNLLNKYIIQLNKNIYFLDIPSFLNLSLIVNQNTSDNIDKIKQQIIFSLSEIIQIISLNKILKLPISERNNFSIIYNFFRGSIFCLKNVEKNLLVRIYDFEIDDNSVECGNTNNYSIIYQKKHNQEINEQKILMGNLLKNIKVEIEQLKQIDLNNNNKNEYINKILEEFKINEDKLKNYLNSKDINNDIQLIDDCYYNLFNIVQMFGKIFQIDEEENLKYNLLKRKKMYNNLEKIDENMKNKKRNIEKKLKIIEENENKIKKLNDENNNYIYENYLKNANYNNEGKNCCNELLKRVNNEILKNMNFIQDQIKQEENFTKLNFEQFKAFPLTLKYLNDIQEKDINHLLVLIKKLFLLLNQFCEQLKNQKK